MCFLFHKWSKWSVPTKEIWKTRTLYHKVLIPGSERDIVRFKQDRTCAKCGKYEARFVNMNDNED